MNIVSDTRSDTLVQAALTIRVKAEGT